MPTVSAGDLAHAREHAVAYARELWFRARELSAAVARGPAPNSGRAAQDIIDAATRLRGSTSIPASARLQLDDALCYAQRILGELSPPRVVAAV